MKVSNLDNIRSWSEVPMDDVVAIPDEGDVARQELLNPALFELLGEVEGKRILDAGCGNGYLSRMLARQGATVVGLEPAEAFYQYCIKRELEESLGIEYVQQDLSSVTGLAVDFDVVVANMVLLDIPDYTAAMQRCIKLLKPGGRFIFSLNHPCFPGREDDWRRLGRVEIEDYFDEVPVKMTWGYNFYRPLSRYFEVLFELGCVVDGFIEPRLDEEFVQNHPDATRNFYVPQFVVVRATKG